MYQFSFYPYRRPFKQPLETHHGRWSVRQGLILRLQDEAGRIGLGEVAPLPWFGSETLEQAIAFCRQLPKQLSEPQILAVPSALPACQFGLGTAWEAIMARTSKLDLPQYYSDKVSSPCTGPPSPPILGETRSQSPAVLGDLEGQCKIVGAPQQLTEQYWDLPLISCGLLPTGAQALQAWPDLWQQGYRTLKWKIGVAPIEEESMLFEALVQQLPPTTQLRLDANGGLSLATAQQWLEICDQLQVGAGRYSSKVTIEYLEQPLPIDQFDTMLQLGSQSLTPLALDESVATLAQLQSCLSQGWQGIVIVKPAICGYPQQLRQICQTHDLDVVLSSVFETEVGRRACLQLAQELSSRGRAIGFGINHWFETEEG